MSTGKIVTGILLGAAAGVIAGILFAPDKGTKTRRKIAEKGAGLVRSAQDKYNDYTNAASEKYDWAKEKVREFTRDGQSEDLLGGQGQGDFKAGGSTNY